MQPGTKVFIIGSVLIAAAAFALSLQTGSDKPSTPMQTEVTTSLEFAGAPQVLDKVTRSENPTPITQQQWAAQEANAGAEERKAEQLYSTGNESEGNAAYARAVKIRSQSPWWQSELPITLNAWAKHYVSSDPNKAERLMIESANIQDKLPDANPVRLEAHEQLYYLYRDLKMKSKQLAQEAVIARLRAAAKADEHRVKTNAN